MKISVVIPAYNGAKYIRQCLESVLKQTRSADQIAVMIDESRDQTEEICRSFGDAVEIYRNSPATGFVDAWNRAVSKAKYEWICLLHQDDLIESDFLEAAEKCIKENPDVRFVYGLCNYIDQNGKSIREPESGDPEWIRQTKEEYLRSYLEEKANRCPGVLMYRDIFHEFPFRKEPGLVADNDFFWRAASKFNIMRINRRVASFRHHPESATHTFADLEQAMFEDYIWIIRDYRSSGLFPDNSILMHTLWKWIVKHGSRARFFAVLHFDMKCYSCVTERIQEIRKMKLGQPIKKSLVEGLFFGTLPFTVLFPVAWGIKFAVSVKKILMKSFALAVEK